GETVGVLAESLLDGERLELVVVGRGRAVRVDVADLFGRDAGVRDGPPHGAHGAGRGLVGHRDVEGVAGHSVADHLGVNPCAARARGAGGRGGRVRPLRAEAYGDLSGGEVDDGRGDEEGRDAAGAVVEELLVLALDGPEVADAAADVGARALGHLLAARAPDL